MLGRGRQGHDAAYKYVENRPTNVYHLLSTITARHHVVGVGKFSLYPLRA